MSKIYDYCSLFFLNLKIKLINLIEFIKVVTKYYGNPTFFKIDSYLVLSYLFHNPFKISKQFLLNKGEDSIYTYGETPLTTLDFIAQECSFSARDIVFELGCGRGRTCFWLNQFIGCSVVGVDYVPTFIEKATFVKNKFDVDRVEFRLQDMIETNFAQATIVYLYGTCLSKSFIQALAKRLMVLPRGTKIITVSYSLIDYSPQNSFELLKCFPARFTWGNANVYFHVKL